jgi:hypothetical protein
MRRASVNVKFDVKFNIHVSTPHDNYTSLNMQIFIPDTLHLRWKLLRKYVVPEKQKSLELGTIRQNFRTADAILTFCFHSEYFGLFRANTLWSTSIVTASVYTVRVLYTPVCARLVFWNKFPYKSKTKACQLGKEQAYLYPIFSPSQLLAS